MTRIIHDNFNLNIEDIKGSPMGDLVVLYFTDPVSGIVDEFPIQAADARKIGARMQGTAVVTAPAGALHGLPDLRKPQ